MSVQVVLNHCSELPFAVLLSLWENSVLARRMFGALLLPHAIFRQEGTQEAGVWLAGGSLPQVLAGWGFLFEEATL